MKGACSWWQEVLCRTQECVDCESNSIQGNPDESGNLQPSIVPASVLGTEVYSACALLQNFIPGPDLRFVYFDSLFSPG